MANHNYSKRLLFILYVYVLIPYAVISRDPQWLIGKND